jgi:hypothetical protein
MTTALRSVMMMMVVMVVATCGLRRHRDGGHETKDQNQSEQKLFHV